MLLTAACFIIFAILYKNYMIYKSITHPSVAFSALWLFQFLGIFSFSNLFIDISFEAIFVVIFGIILFDFGISIANMTVQNSQKDVRARLIDPDDRKFVIVTFLAMFFLVQQLVVFNSLSAGMEIGAALVHVRTLVSVKFEDVYGFYKYGNAFSQGALLLITIAMLRHGINRFRLTIFVGLFLSSIGMAFLSTGRGPVVQIIIMCMISYVLLSKNANISLYKYLRPFTITILIMFGVFWTMGNAMGKVGDTLALAFFDVVYYQFSSVPALSVYLTGHEIDIVGGDGGARTFRFILAFLDRIGFETNPPNLVNEFVNVPYPTNIYTIFLLPISDFGWSGLLFYPILIGIFHGKIYNWVLRNMSNDFALYVLVISYIPMLQSIGGDAYISLMSTWIQFYLIGLFLTSSKKSSLGTSSYD